MAHRLQLRWHALRRMSWAERGGAARAWLALAGVRLALWVLGFRRSHALLARLAGAAVDLPAGPAGPAEHPAIPATVRAVDRAARLGPRPPTCLPRALTLWWLLRRQGLAAELRIGTRRAADRLEAHAWVECEGRVLDDRADIRDRFAAFDEAMDAFTGPLRARSGLQPRESTQPLGGSGR